ncbi:hypothetical protein HN014_10800 [Aquimarina sp. TRL1]|uniref:hypothetical protein n=1 Tax=Aquimarina sp. (strain TRL1) TaxID=2736252 RepID=UPI001589C849|nr:hypothetical protein [Aquimarina sp. TRL1]QKX05381.1 hypothetical protein HN014_10800 [Aquimarina sp. TRL1]
MKHYHTILILLCIGCNNQPHKEDVEDIFNILKHSFYSQKRTTIKISKTVRTPPSPSWLKHNNPLVDVSNDSAEFEFEYFEEEDLKYLSKQRNYLIAHRELLHQISDYFCEEDLIDIRYYAKKYKEFSPEWKAILNKYDMKSLMYFSYPVFNKKGNISLVVAYNLLGYGGCTPWYEILSFVKTDGVWKASYPPFH